MGTGKDAVCCFAAGSGRRRRSAARYWGRASAGGDLSGQRGGGEALADGGMGRGECMPLIEQRGAQIVFTGSAGEAELIDPVLAALQGDDDLTGAIRSLAGRTGTLAAVYRRCAVVGRTAGRGTSPWPWGRRLSTSTARWISAPSARGATRRATSSSRRTGRASPAIGSTGRTRRWQNMAAYAMSWWKM